MTCVQSTYRKLSVVQGMIGETGVKMDMLRERIDLNPEKDHSDELFELEKEMACHVARLACLESIVEPEICLT